MSFGASRYAQSSARRNVIVSESSHTRSFNYNSLVKRVRLRNTGRNYFDRTHARIRPRVVIKRIFCTRLKFYFIRPRYDGTTIKR